MNWWLTGGIIVVFGFWLVFNWGAPLAVLARAESLSLGRLPADLLKRPEARQVRFYLADLRRSYGFSVWLWPRTVVVFDRRFFAAAGGDLVRFVVAHELGHALRGDHVERGWAVVTGVVLLPMMRRRLALHEINADLYAIALTGQRRDQFRELA